MLKIKKKNIIICLNVCKFDSLKLIIVVIFVSNLVNSAVTCRFFYDNMIII